MKIVTDPLENQLKQVGKSRIQADDPQVEASVRQIIANVVTNGDQALREYERQFDGVALEEFRIPDAQLTDALAKISPELREELDAASRNITSFHQKELENGFVDCEKDGVLRGQKILPIARVGLYVPGGTASYPSSVLMNAIPAKLAGVERLVMVTPPQKDGIDQAVLAAAKLSGVDEVYQLGGAQAIAALAYGTESVPRVDKIFGPGNIYVATAKKLVFGQVGIDMFAGPSEIGVIADQSADATQVAADLLSQAEHDPRARPILATTSLEFAKDVSQAIDSQLESLPRQEIARSSIENQGFIAVLPQIKDLFALMNSLAPEHLEIQLPDPSSYLSQVKNAGSVFLGPYASEPLGDYVAGPNHILPTSGTARFSSPVGVYDFVKRTQFIQYTKAALEKEADYVTRLARTEGLEGHARAIESRGS